jgi:hypothetical protein
MQTRFQVLSRALLIGSLMLLLTSCATHNSPEHFANPYGFFSGLIHGLLAPWTILINIISWVLSLIGVSFLEDVQIVGRPNTGFLFYYVGFFIGFSGNLGAANR